MTGNTNVSIYAQPVSISLEACREAGVDPNAVAWAEAHMDQIQVPEGQTVHVIAYGEGCMNVHFKPLTHAELRDWRVWAGQADLAVRIGDYYPRRLAMQLAAEARWPRALVLKHICTCCCDDLVAFNECGYCGTLTRWHHGACPSLLSSAGPDGRRVTSPQFLAHLVWQDGYDSVYGDHMVAERFAAWMKYSGPATPATWKLGFERAMARRLR